jgi:hypothetical protein
MGRVSKHWILREACRSLEKWREDTHNRLNAKRLLSGAVTFFNTSSSLKAARIWHDAAQAIRARIASAESRGIAHWRSRHMLRGVSKAGIFAENRIDAAEDRRVALAHFDKRAKTTTHRALLTAAAATKKRRAELRRRMQRSREDALEHWFLEKADRVFAKWGAHSKARAERLDSMQTAVSFWNSLQCGVALDKWMDYYEKEQQQYHQLRTAVAVFTQSSLTTAVRQWQERAAEWREDREDMLAAHRQALVFWSMRSSQKALSMLLANAYECKVEHQNQQDAILYWAEARLVAAVNSWRHDTYIWYCAKVAYHGAANWSDKAATETAVELWRNATAMLKKRAERNRKKAMAEYKHKELARFWKLWRDKRYAEIGKNICDEAALLWLQRKLDDAVVRWRNYAEFRSIHNDLMARADFRYYHKSYSYYIADWRAYRSWRGAVFGEGPGLTI